MTNTEIIQEIDLLHEKANEDFKNKNLDAYTGVFADDLQYLRLNGRLVDKGIVAKDVQRQFDRLHSHTSKYEREKFEIKNEFVIERLNQKAEFVIKAFWFFKKRWNVNRVGVYQWAKQNGVWKITRVEIIQEKIK